MVTYLRNYRFPAFVAATLTSVSAPARQFGCDCNAPCLRGLTPRSPVYSGLALDRPPQPFGDLRDDVAEQQQGRRPDQRRYEIGELEAPIRHLEYHGGKRHRGPQRSEK